LGDSWRGRNWAKVANTIIRLIEKERGGEGGAEERGEDTVSKS
jgi:hypothetical protein